MPINYKEYHPQWKQISKAIVARGKNQCELCGAPNNQIVFRPVKGSELPRPWYFDGEVDDCGYKGCYTKIILTVHHIDSNKENNSQLNLIALCQKCHLRLDLAKHIYNRRMKRLGIIRKLEAA
ncbi:hypothetical protein NO1_1228 [Candidatus Termititenax aidoneus]|uniref:HNH domain-containing protein n=1 Tax=Termititenax aidoneus TaxID=2218524 RepID=A0A388TB30_TERA1|nr:hypothetical protein NO1_1228 [Candidatus Termititenax aidoneus]